MKLKFFIAILCSSYLLTGASIEINDATEAELDSLKGLGPRLTKKILQEKFIQPFGGWQDFIHRLGFQSTTLIHQLSHQGVTINGQSLNYESTQ